MAGGPIEINFTANVSDATAGTDALGKALDGVGDAAEKSAEASGAAAKATLADQKRAAQEILQATRQQSLAALNSWREQQTAAGRATESIERDYKAMEREIENSISKQSLTVAHSTTETIGNAQRGIVTLREKLGGLFQGIAPALSSFDGSIESIGTTISGLGSLIPGVGGLIGGALGGVASGLFRDWQENTEKSKQAVSDMYQDMIASGNDYVSKELVNKNIQDTINDTQKYNQVKKDAHDLGLSLSTVLRANAGDQVALNTAINASSDAYNNASEKVNALADKGGKIPPVLAQQREAAREAQDRFLGLARSQDTAADKANAYRAAADKAGSDSVNAAGGVDALHAAVDRLPSTKNIKFGVDRSDYDREVASINGRTIHVNVAFVPTRGNLVY